MGKRRFVALSGRCMNFIKQCTSFPSTLSLWIAPDGPSEALSITFRNRDYAFHLQGFLESGFGLRSLHFHLDSLHYSRERNFLRNMFGTVIASATTVTKMVVAFRKPASYLAVPFLIQADLINLVKRTLHIIFMNLMFSAAPVIANVKKSFEEQICFLYDFMRKHSTRMSQDRLQFIQGKIKTVLTAKVSPSFWYFDYALGSFTSFPCVIFSVDPSN